MLATVLSVRDLEVNKTGRLSSLQLGKFFSENYNKNE